MHATRTDALLQLYPPLAGLSELVADLPVLRVPAGAALFAEQAPCQGFPMVLEGEVRVSRCAPNGRELELYRVQPGQLCLVSSAALFDHRPLGAHGTTTTETALVLLPPPAFRQALGHEIFRDFVLGLFASRMAELTTLIEAVAFQRLDARLAGALLGHGQQLHTTHQALADELGTVREIVTRLLRRFEREGLVELSRECITIRNSGGLRARTQGQGD